MIQTNSEATLLAELEARISDARVAAWLEGAADRLTRRMEDDPELDIDFEVVPAAVLDPPPPTVSAWVFILRRGLESGAERHPNSTQRMAALRGSGVFQTWNGTEWLSHPLSPETGGHLENRWVSIPPNVWHQGAPPNQHWVVVSFHTAPADQLIEERGDPRTELLSHRARYLEESTQ